MHWIVWFLLLLSPVFLVVLLRLGLILLQAYNDFCYGRHAREQVRISEDAEELFRRKIPSAIRRSEGIRPLEIIVRAKREDRVLRYADGYYNGSSHTITLRNGASARTALHEYGHHIEYRFFHPGVLSLQKDWQDVLEKATKRRVFFIFNKIRVLWDPYYISETEFFAECFARYYLSSQARNRLKEQFLEAHAYFEEFERKHISQQVSWTI